MEGKEVLSVQGAAPIDMKTRNVRVSREQYKVPDGVTPHPFRSESQSFALVNLCHVRQKPQSKYPGYRILGAFRTAEEAKRHQETAYPDKSMESFFVVPMCQVFPICTSAEKQIDPGYINSLKDELVNLHNKNAATTKEEHAKNIAEQKTGVGGRSVMAQKMKKRPAEGSVTATTQIDAVIRGSQTIHGQEFAVVTTLLDIRESTIDCNLPEPLVAILFVSSEAECINYAKFTANRHVEDAVFDIVQMYSWLFPEHIDMSKIGKISYADEHLQNIVDARKRNEVLEEVMKKEESLNIKVTEIDSKSVTIKNDDSESTVINIQPPK